MTSPKPSLLLLLISALLILSGPATALPQDDGMEDFEEADPYTEGEMDRMDKLGYERFSGFMWRDGHLTGQVAETLGGMPVLWVETEHFKIGSTLTSYRFSEDSIEKKRLEAELKTFKKRLGKVKLPKRKLDAWLRLHLYAQRLEQLYDDLEADFGIQPDDYTGHGPNFGRSTKFLVLLCERRSEFKRYLSRYVQVDGDFSFRCGWDDGDRGFVINNEAVQDLYDAESAETPRDTVLLANIISGLSMTMIEGYRLRYDGLPLWISTAVGHRCVRRIDPRWVTGYGLAKERTIGEDDYKWEPRVRNLAKNEFFISTRDMFGISTYEEMHTRDHMVLWSRLEYLLDEADGSPRGFLNALALAPPTGTPEDVKAALVERQVASLLEHYGVSPEELDEAWSKWVLKTYDKK